jgi:hypothetical protein
VGPAVRAGRLLPHAARGASLNCVTLFLFLTCFPRSDVRWSDGLLGGVQGENVGPNTASKSRPQRAPDVGAAGAQGVYAVG